jgi:tetratricopeptide (TPR) repeat protein
MLPPSLSALLRNLAFVNPNNQAGLLNVGFALAVGRVGQGGSTRQQTLFGLIATALALLVLFVGSRGGYLTLLAVLAMTAAAMPRPPRYLRRDERDRQLSAIRSVGSVVLVILVLGALLALPMIEKELQPTQLHDEKLQQMARMFSLVRGAWPVGAGPGSLPVLGGMDVLFGRYRHDFAENLLLERALDQGLIFTLGFTVALVLMLRRMVRRWDGMTAVPSIVVAITALLMANLVDFSLEMAGGLVPMLALAACAERQLPAPSVRESGRRLFHGRRAVMAWSGLALTAAAWLLTVAVPGVTRRVPDALAGQKPAQAKAIVARHFVHDQHAFYLLGRLLLDEGDTHGGMRALDRAVALRPDSKHAHLFRFAARVEAGDTQGAMADLRWLLHSDGDTFSRTLQLCARSTRGEAVLVAAIPDLTDLSYSIGLEYEHTRPDLLERLALALRDKFPDKRFGIEAVRGHLYVKRGMMEPARHIATAMLVEPTTRDQGWQLEADIQAHTGHPLEAFHLLADLCNRHPTDFNVCQYAMQAGLAATKPVMVLAFLEKHRELMMESPSQAAAYWYGYGSAKSMLNDDDEAVQAARTAHGLMPEDIDTALLLAHSLGRIGQHEEERDLLSHLKESHPNDARVLALWKQVEQVLSPLAGLVPDAPSVASPTAATRTQ